MYLNDFKNFIESEKKYSKHTVSAYVNDLEEFIDKVFFDDEEK